MDTFLDIVKWFADNATSPRALVVAGIVWVFHQLAGDRADNVASRVKEIASIAFVGVRALVEANVIPLRGLDDEVMSRAKWLLDRLHIPASDTILGMLRHELDLLEVDMLRPQIAAGLNDVAVKAQSLADTVKAAAAQGLASGRQLVANIGSQACDGKPCPEEPTAPEPAAPAPEAAPPAAPAP